MDLDGLVTYCIQKGGVEESFPFDEEVLVFKVMGKMFCLCNIHEIPLRINLKCDPEWSILLRDEYPEIVPGYHMNKKHWNTVTIGEGLLDQSFIMKLIDHSYDRIVASLTKAKQAELAKLKKEDDG